MAAAAVAHEQCLAAILLSREAVEVVLRRPGPRTTLVVARLIRRHRSNELRECLSNPLFSDLGVAKRTLKQAGIHRIACEPIDERLQFLSHFESALDRLEDHLLEVPGSLVPEESRSLVKTQ